MCGGEHQHVPVRDSPRDGGPADPDPGATSADSQGGQHRPVGGGAAARLHQAQQQRQQGEEQLFLRKLEREHWKLVYGQWETGEGTGNWKREREIGEWLGNRKGDGKLEKGNGNQERDIKSE